jgi:MYXO-CTERM domain-containing protein
MWKALAIATALVAVSRPAAAWTIGSQLDNTGCHERITTLAFRAARMMFQTAPVIAPTADEAALIDDAQFAPPADFVHDLAAMSLLFGVRDNDLKGHNPLDTLQLVQVHGNPDTQEEHCIRNKDDDGTAGDPAALERCRQFIHTRIAEALQGLAADGTVDPAHRMTLAIYVSFAGRVDPMLPQFYVKLGQAVHALEDGFTHTYRTTDGAHVTTVMNWIDYVSNAGASPERDGPPHVAGMDHCEGSDPLVARNFTNATAAATALMEIAMDPSKTSDDKLAAVDALTAQYLTYQPGCDFTNNYCNAPEANVVAPSTGCNASGAGAGWFVAIAIGALGVLRRRRGLVIVATCAIAGSVAAQPAGSGSGSGSGSMPGPVVTDAPANAPAVPATPDKPADAAAVGQGHEPGRDVKTPTVNEVEKIREDKQLGNPFGVSFMLGGSFVHGALAGSVGGRYRLDERWTLGLDAEWNPWITSIPWALKAGAGSVYGTVIHRYPMKLDRVNLRTTLNLGVSTLLFDVAGAPKFDVGPYVGLSPLGIDYDLGNSVRLVFDPLSVSVPVPHLGLIPLYYEQFRTMIGIQIGG